jgi:hypothetical protein
MLERRSTIDALRTRIRHPIIDIDGHAVELAPVVVELVAAEGGRHMAERFLRSRDSDAWNPT